MNSCIELNSIPITLKISSQKPSEITASISKLAVKTVVCDDWFRERLKDGSMSSLEFSSERKVFGGVWILKMRMSESASPVLDLNSVADPAYVVQTSGMTMSKYQPNPAFC